MLADAGRGFPGFAADESDEDINDMPWNWGRISREDAVAELAGKEVLLPLYFDTLAFIPDKLLIGWYFPRTHEPDC